MLKNPLCWASEFLVFLVCFPCEEFLVIKFLDSSFLMRKCHAYSWQVNTGYYLQVVMRNTEWENSKYYIHSFELSLIYLDFLCVCKYLNMLKRVWPNRLHEYIPQSVSNPSWDTLYLYFFFLPNHIHILIVHTYLLIRSNVKITNHIY